MNICILTQPLHNNYGGLLQAYALQVVLRQMGHEVWTEDRRRKNERSLIGKMLSSAKRLVRICLSPSKARFIIKRKELEIISRHTRSFVEKYIRTTVPVYSTSKDVFFKKYRFDAYVVGSDQVWRKDYSWGLDNYFLDFTEGWDVKRVAYAASFGVDEWEISPEKTKLYRRLIQRFDAVSVREESGVRLCKEYLGIDAVRVLDPTMLLSQSDYKSLVRREGDEAKTGETLFYYILDRTGEKEELIATAAELLKLEAMTACPEHTFAEAGRENIEGCIYPKVTEWINGIANSKFVITDSFHGCVFAVIFNKPFIVTGNEARGMTRIRSLLSLFDLEYRCVCSSDDLIEDIINKPIDWQSVNEKLDEERGFSLVFLTDNLPGKIASAEISE